MPENNPGSHQNAGKIIKHFPKYEPLADTVQRIIDDLGERRKGPELKTGLEVVDKGLYGLHKGHLTILAARAGNGKTSMACNMAFELVNAGKKVAFVSLEMSREQILSKIFCAHHGIDMFRFSLGVVTEIEKAKLQSFKKLCEEIPLRVIDDYCFTQDELYTLIEYLEFRPEVLILDHLQHIRAIDNSRRSERENLTEYLRFLKEIAMRHKIAVLCLSQINREGDESPSLKTLKGTGAAEEMADSVLLLYLKQKDDAVMDHSKIIEAECRIAKHRFGPVGKFNLLFEANTGNFKNLEAHREEPVKDYHEKY